MSPAARNRAFSLFVVALVWAGAAALWPEDVARERALYTAIATVGYGHLVGSALFGRSRRTAGVASTLFTGTSVAVGFCIYMLLLESFPLAIIPFSLLLTWHTLENDRQLPVACGANGPLPRLSRAPRTHLWFVPAALATVLVAASSAEVHAALDARRPAAPLAQLFTVPWPLAWRPRLFDAYGIPALYHLVSWLTLLIDRARREQDRAVRARRIRALVSVHAVPLALAPAILLAEGATAAFFREVLYGPHVYLYWSGLHVVQTAVARNRAPSAPAASTRSEPISRGPVEEHIT